MKKISFMAFALVLAFVSSAMLDHSQLNAAVSDPADYEKISQEAERNRELLEIWKEHVKTLTKERDDAFSQLEKMKAGRGTSPMAQFGGVETAPLPSAQMTAQIQSLEEENARLQQALNQRASTGSPSSREIQMQMSALQNQIQQSKRELNEAREDKDKAIQEREKALSQVDRLSEEVTTLRAGGSSSVAPDEISRNLQSALDTQKQRYEDLQKRFRELQNDYDELKDRSENSRSSRADDNKIVDLEGQIRELKSENARLKSDIQLGTTVSGTGGSPDREKEAFMRQARELQYENDTLKAQIEKLQVVEKELANTRAYFTPLLRDAQEKNDRLNSENITLKTDTDRMRREYEQMSRDILNIKSQSQTLQKETEGAQGEIGRLKGQNQKLTADLQSAVSDRDSMETQIATYKAQLQTAAADREKFRLAEEEFKKKEAELQSGSGRVAQLEQELKSREAQFQQIASAKDSQIQQLTSQLSGIEKSNKEYESRSMDTLKSSEKYQTALRANLQDMKNLKSNFEAYLESLVASFEERTR